MSFAMASSVSVIFVSFYVPFKTPETHFCFIQCYLFFLKSLAKVFSLPLRIFECRCILILFLKAKTISLSSLECRKKGPYLKKYTFVIKKQYFFVFYEKCLGLNENRAKEKCHF